jgi:hypothetical protein
MTVLSKLVIFSVCQRTSECEWTQKGQQYSQSIFWTAVMLETASRAISSVLTNDDPVLLMSMDLTPRCSGACPSVGPRLGAGDASATSSDLQTMLDVERIIQNGGSHTCRLMHHLTCLRYSSCTFGSERW